MIVLRSEAGAAAGERLGRGGGGVLSFPKTWRFRRLGAAGGRDPKSAAPSIVWEARWDGIFVYVLIVKLVHFLFILRRFFFYTSYLVESSEYIENALYFSISQMIIVTHKDFSCT